MIEGKRGRLTIRKAHHRASDGILLVLEERPAVTPEALRRLALPGARRRCSASLRAPRRAQPRSRRVDGSRGGEATGRLAQCERPLEHLGDDAEAAAAELPAQNGVLNPL